MNLSANFFKLEKVGGVWGVKSSKDIMCLKIIRYSWLKMLTEWQLGVCVSNKMEGGLDIS